MIEIPGYSIMRLLGRGGMAAVYLAVQQSLDREVALKVLPRHREGDSAAGERFLREARIAASLHHPHIVPIHDFGVVGDNAYIAMAYEPGGSVAPTAGGVLEPADALRVVRDIAAALDYAHARGVVHRDIKPDNILRLHDGGATLADFGIARVMESRTALTAEGTSVGTPHYMSPEQLRGEQVDGRSDLYSLGVVLFELLTGARPYEGQDGWAIGTQHLSAPVPRLPAPLAWLQPLVDSLLAKAPKDRPATARELLQRIDRLLGRSPAASTRDGAQTTVLGAADLAPARPFARRRPVSVVLGLGALVLAAAAVLAWRAGGGVAGSARPTAAHTPVPAPAGPATTARRSIAVLPFTDLSEDGSSRYFADGISEELLNVLTRVDGVDVASRTSSFAFAGGREGAADIARKLKVRYLLQGSVRKSGDRVRIAAQLVDATSDRQLWSDAYDRQLTDIFAIQEEIANAIVSALQVPMAAGAGAKPVIVPRATRSQQAYDDYLRARELFIARKNLGESLRLFEQVTRTDPGFARAWEGLAAVASVARSWELSGRDFDALARTAAERALALDQTLSTPWGVLGNLEQVADPPNWERSLELLDRAVAADPGDANAYQWRGIAWMRLGYFDKALADFQRCLKVDPGYLNCERQLALAHLYSGRRAEGLRVFDLSFQKGYTGRYSTFLRPLVAAGKRREADALLDAVGAPAGGREALIRVLASPGEPSAADREALRRYFNSPDARVWAARIPTRMAILLGDYDRLSQAPDVDVMQLVVWEDGPPGFVTSEARVRLMERFGLPAYWRRHGFPPRCRPQGDTGFSCR